MAPQVNCINVVVHAPAVAEVKVSIVQEPIDIDEEPITSGKLNGKSFKDALENPDYVKWILNNRQRLKNPNLKRLAAYLAAKQ